MSKIVLKGSITGQVELQANSTAGSGLLTLPTGVDTLIGKNTTDILTNKTIDGTTNEITISASNTQIDISVDNLTALKALTKRPSAIIMEGRSTPGDGGGGTFYWIAGDSTTADDALIVQPTSGPTGRYKRLYSGPVNVRWWGASGNSTASNNVLAIQTAINLMESIGGGTVFIPGDTNKYQINATIEEKQRVFIVGEGPRVTDIQGTGNFPIFRRSGTNVSGINGGGISNLGIWGSWLSSAPGSNTNSIGIDCHYGHRGVYENVHFYGCYIGHHSEFSYGMDMISVKAPSGVTGEQCYHGFYWDSCTDLNNNNAHECVSCTAYDTYNSGWRLLGFSGSTFTSCRAENCGVSGSAGYGWELGNSSSGTPIENGHWSNCLGDAGFYGNWLISKGAGSRVEQLQFVNCQSGGAGVNGWWFYDVNKTSMVGCVAFQSYQNALRLTNSPITVTDFVADEYNFGNVTGYAGINIENTNGAVIIGCEVTTTKTTGGGRSLDENGTSNNNIIIGNKLPQGGLPASNSKWENNTGIPPLTLQQLFQLGFDYTNSQVAKATQNTYTITTPIVITLTNHINEFGFDGNGCTIISNLPPGTNQPLITIRLPGSGVGARYMTLRNFTIMGNGNESDGIFVNCPVNDSWIYNFNFENVNVINCGRHGINCEGSVFEGIFLNCWVDSNLGAGARLSHTPVGVNTGQASALQWVGGGARKNLGPGILLEEGCRDLHVSHAYFVDGEDVGIYADLGLSNVSNCGFENNQGWGIRFGSFTTVRDCTFSTYGKMSIGVEGFLAGNAVIDGCSMEYYGPDPDTTKLGHFAGTGKVLVTNDSLVTTSGSAVIVPGGLRTP